MPRTVFPCLWFDGSAAHCAASYCSIFENSGLTSEGPLVSQFQLNGYRMMGLNGGSTVKINSTVSMFTYVKGVNNCKAVWNGLAEEGIELVPLNAYPWSPMYGSLVDRFGLSWQVMLADEDKIVTHIKFTGPQYGNAMEAMKYYERIFPNTGIDRYNIYPNDSPFAGMVSHANFHMVGLPLVVIDGPGSNNFSFNEGVSFVLSCDTQAEIDHYWNLFSKDGGTEGKQGWCTDKFGVSWQVLPSIIGELMHHPEKGLRVLNAISSMKKVSLVNLLKA